MDTTATANVDSKSPYSGVRKHVEHDENIEHSNKDIEFEKTEYNQSGKPMNLGKLLDKHYGQFVKKHDRDMIAKKRPERAYGTVSKYLKGSKGNFDERAVFTFGDLKTKTKILETAEKHGISEGEVLTAFSDALATHARGFNKRNSCIKMTEFTTNVDEKGAPHNHAQLVPIGHAKSGKPSMTLNQALQDQFGTKSNKGNLAKFRAQEDEALVKVMDKTFSERFPELYAELGGFSLTRTGEAQNVDMDVYKELEDLKKQKEAVNAEITDLKSQKSTLTEDLKESRNAVVNNRKLANDAKNSYLGLADKIATAKTEHTTLESENTALRQQNANLAIEKGNFENMKNDQEEIYDFIADGYSILGKNYSMDGKNVNSEVARGNLVVKNGGQEHSGINLLKSLMQQATEQQLQKLKQREEEFQKPKPKPKPKPTSNPSTQRRRQRSNDGPSL